jgi:glycosyltransferase involved in cell wall biosynthesis
MKIIQLSERPISQIYKQISNGAEIERHNALFGYDALKESQWEVIAIDSYNKNFLNRIINGIGFRLGFTHLVLQLKCLRHAYKADLIYCHILQLAPLLSTLRKFGLLKTPVMAISHDAFSERATAIDKVLSLDKILFLGEATLNVAMQKANLPATHKNFIEWGVDLPFYTNWKARQTIAPQQDYIIASGLANRDYDLLLNVFTDISNLKLFIFGRNFNPTVPIPDNAFIDNVFNSESVANRRDHYYNALAVAIPLKNHIDWCNGCTVMFEAMAMSKPIIMTRSRSNLVDVEKEKIGLLVDFGDKEGWRQAIEYLKSNPEEARLMGERGFLLAQRKYNYKLFCSHLIEEIGKLKTEK